MLANAGFESGMANWTLVLNPPANASATLDQGMAAEGNTSARVTVLDDRNVRHAELDGLA